MWFRGDLHVHSARSAGGEMTPAQVVAAARAAGLHFLAATEHNTTDTHDAWQAAGGDGLLVIGGQAVTTASGHWLAVGVEPGTVVDWRYGIRDSRLAQGLAQVRRAGGIGVAAHPHAPYPSGLLCYPFEAFDVVEVWNGPWRSTVPWQADNETALAEWGRGLAAGVLTGRWQPAAGNSDTHLPGQIGVPQLVVQAAGLTSTAILAAVRAGRCWIAGSGEVDLTFTADGFEVHGAPEGTVTLHTERGVVHRQPAAEPVAWSAAPDDAIFVRAEVRHPDGAMAALTNPVLPHGPGGAANPAWIPRV